MSGSRDYPSDKARKLITIRLEKEPIADLKALAKLRGVRYRTLINNVLCVWVTERKVQP